MRIAVPTVDRKLCTHFGHSEQFVLIDVEGEEIRNTQAATPPPHAPGVLPKWLHEQGADIIIASGMGRRAQMLFNENDIAVVVGAPILEPEELVKQYINGTLKVGDEAGPGDFAENITTSGIDLISLPIGARLKLGEAIVKVTRIGKEKHLVHTYNYRGVSILPHRGVFASVEKSGHVRAGDRITLIP